MRSSMFTPIRSGFSDSDSFGGNQNWETNLRLQSDERCVTITHDGFTIGSNKHCDLSLDDDSVPTLLSIIHVQNGAVWIEAADESTRITINGRPYRRMALRHDDRLKLGNEEFRILMNAEPIAQTGSVTLKEDLSLLTAEELCDRILAEQTMVSDFVSGQRSGWDALLRAIEEANADDIITDEATEFPQAEIESEVAPEAEQIALSNLLEQIQELNEAITDKTKELSDREKEVLETTSILEESQQQVTQRIDELLQQLNRNEPPSDLRASA